MARNYTFDEEVTLISAVEGNNSIGDAIRTESTYVSYAEIVSPYMKEAYEALSKGFRAEFVVVLPNWYDDYHGERQLEYNGVRYNIIRAYKAKDLSCELTVTKIKANVPDLGTLANAVYGGVF